MLRWPLMMSFVVLGLLLVKDIFPTRPSWPRRRTSSRPTPVRAAERVAGASGPGRQPPQTFPQELTAGLTHLLGPDWGPKLNLLSFHGTVDRSGSCRPSCS